MKQKHLLRFGRWLKEHEFILMVVLLVVVLRLPNLYEPYWYGDEGIYLTIGQAMKRGIRLYAEIIDHKTPMIYWFSQAAGKLFGLKLILMAASLASIWFFYHLSKRLLQKDWAAKLTTLLFGLATTLPALEGNIANGELLLMPFILASMWWFWKIIPPDYETTTKELAPVLKPVAARTPLLIGIFFGLALLTKVPSVFDFVALGIFGLFFLPRVFKKTSFQSTIWLIGWILFGFLAAILVSLVYFLLAGSLQAYLDFGLLYNFKYMGDWQSPFSHPAAQFFSSLPGRSLIVLSYLMLIYFGKKKLSLELRFVLVWLGLSFYAALLSFRPYPHYLLQVLPAASLIVGFILIGGKKLQLFLVMLMLTLYWLTIQIGFGTYPTVGYYQNFLRMVSQQASIEDYWRWFDSQTPATYEVARFLASNTAEDERVFIWGDQPLVYALANRSPVGRYTVAFHVISFNAFDETISALETQKPKYILDYKQNPESFPRLYQLLSAEYVPVTKIQGAVVHRHLPLE